MLGHNILIHWPRVNGLISYELQFDKVMYLHVQCLKSVCDIVIHSM